MAEEIKIKIEGMTINQQRHEQMKADYISAQKSGVTDKVKNSERDWAIHSAALEELLKIQKPTAEEIRKIVHEFKALQEIITKLGNAMSPISEKTKEVIEAEEKLTKQREEAVKKAEKAESILAKKKDGELGLKNKYIEDAIKGITYKQGSAKGRQVSLNKFLEMGAANNFDKTVDPTQAQNLYNQLKTKESAAKRDIEESNADITKIDGQISELNTKTTTINPGDKIVINASKVVAAVEKDFADARRAAQDPNKGPVEAGTSFDTNTGPLQKQNSSLGKAFKQFTLYAVAIRAAKSALREAVSTVKELDKYLTEQAMVTGKTRKETYALVGSYQELALQTGATTKEIASVATEYMKQGKSTKDALILTEAATKAAKVARVSVGDSVNYLTTALNGFRLSAEDAMAVSDKFAAVAASSASDYDELAIALSKVASQANLAGMSIDYTTALLTKGLETTREAPETMGTALKTIIARMREMKDYGATLEGDTDINNVESQLAYVGIALKNQQGELRSTEEVLDELGKKWDTLNKNQQAALAKALAGTRQQSRLIAMMDDYERVTELQEIAQRSAGATAAQAGTYLEGMEAALNKIQVAWEKIVTTITDSEIIIGIFNQLAIIIDNVGNALGNPVGMIAAITTIAMISLNILGTKIKENYIAKLQYKQSLAQQRLELEQNKAQILSIINAKKILKEERKQTIEERKQTIEKWKQQLADEKTDAVTKQTLTQKIAAAELLNKTDEDTVAQAEQSLAQLQLQDSLLKEQESTVGKLIGGFSGIGFAVFGVVKGVTKLAQTMNEVIALKKAGVAWSKIATAQSRKEALAESAVSVAKNPFWGWAIALALLAAAGIAAGVAIAGMNGAFNKDPAKDTAADINELSNDIYKLNEKANAIKEVDRKFSALDDKVIKTSKDMKEMNELLDSAKDKLTKEEKARVDALKTPQAQMAELRRIEEEARKEANAKRQEQLDKLNALSTEDQKKLLTGIDSESVAAQSAIRAIANNELYEYIDGLKEEGKLLEDNAKATENITQAILDQMSAEEAAEFAKNPQKIKDLANNLKDLDVTSIFMDDDAKLKDRVQAFKDVQVALTADEQAYNKFKEAYSEWDVFASMSESALDFIDAAGLSIDQINELFVGYKKLQKQGIQITKDEYQARLENVFSQVNEDFSNFNNVMEANFADLVSKTADGGKQWNALINTIGEQFSISVLDMGQNMEKFKNTISSFYEKSLKWNEMKESEKSQFIADNAKLFEGEGGDTLLQAFESGNYDEIEKAIQAQMGDQQAEILADVNRSLAVEMAKPEAMQNKAYIRQLEGYKEFLEDKENLYKVSLKVQLEQEKNQIDEYKSYLQDQQKELQKSLDKRKEAYQKYFDTINEQKEVEEYEEEAQTLIANLGKLGSDNTAGTAKEKAELQKKLQELEKQHSEEMRQKAQEAVMENLDKQVEEINEKFDKLLDSNHELLLAMRGDLKDPSKFLGGLLSNKIGTGSTGLEIQSYWQELMGKYGNIVGVDTFKDVEFKERNGDLYLNVNGQEILLNQQDQQSVYDAITTALKEIGQR